MTPPAEEGDVREATCPHCKQPFRAEALDGQAARYHGFKCPHCKLFVPFERADST